MGAEYLISIMSLFKPGIFPPAGSFKVRMFIPSVAPFSKIASVGWEDHSILIKEFFRSIIHR
jgi:hypothetical protein